MQRAQETSSPGTRDPWKPVNRNLDPSTFPSPFSVQPRDGPLQPPRKWAELHALEKSEQRCSHLLGTGHSRAGKGMGGTAGENRRNKGTPQAGLGDSQLSPFVSQRDDDQPVLCPPGWRSTLPLWRVRIAPRKDPGLPVFRAAHWLSEWEAGWDALSTLCFF